jgi:hypothetical protein
MSHFRFRAWPTESKIVTQPFGARPDYYARFGLPGHEGVDLVAPIGSKIFSVASGVVKTVIADNRHPYGLHVRISHLGNYETIYAHLQSALVVPGQQVRAGHVLGLAGVSGNTDGPHLHFTLKRAGVATDYPNGIIDPAPFLAPLLDPAYADAMYVRDTVADGTKVGPGARFTQTWVLRNSGNRVWSAGDTLTCIAGPAMNGVTSVPLPALAVGAEGAVSINMVAPAQPGAYTGIWQPTTANGKRFGDPLWIAIEVAAPAPAQAATFVQANGRGFTLSGRPFRFLGFNLRGLTHYGQRSSDPLMYSRPEHRFSQLQRVYDLGARVVRFFVADRDVDAEVNRVRMDRLLEIVTKNFPDLYLIPVFTNLYADVPFHHPGDDTAWLFRNGILSNEFFAGRYRERYLPFVERMVDVFSEAPNIFAWEIGNELKSERANPNDPKDPNPALFVKFNLEVAAAIKRIDPYHLVTTGMKSTHHAWLHTPALQEALYRSPHIDFITIHSYEGKWDREGDLRVYEDATLADRLNKPFIVEEAGFDRELFPDRVAKHGEHMAHWLALGAQGYMPWGFIHAPEIGDGDDSVGICSYHSDFGQLCDLFRQYADRVK